MDDRIQPDNLIIGYAVGYAIVTDERGNLFVCKMPYEAATLGESLPDDDLQPFGSLPEETQRLIRAAAKEMI